MIRVSLDYRSEGIGFQILDGWFSYRQQLDTDYAPPIKVVGYAEADFRILLDYMPDKVFDTDKHDMILICNGGEPLNVATTAMKDLLRRDNVWLISNAYAHNNNDYPVKNIWYPHNVANCNRYWTGAFFPQFYECQTKFSGLERKYSICAINGQDRTWRHHFFKKLLTTVPDIKVRSSLTTNLPIKTLDSQWETVADQQFRDHVNDLYQRQDDGNTENNYYGNSILTGIDGKFGPIAPGFFLLPEYFENSCIVFPETDWQNNFLVITEKSLKCFYSGCLPFPVGGAGVNTLYNELGYRTAWNLLPEYLKAFDLQQDHDQRYDGACQAIRWLYDHPDIWATDLARSFVTNNKTKFLSCETMIDSVKLFDGMFWSLVNDKI